MRFAVRRAFARSINQMVDVVNRWTGTCSHRRCDCCGWHGFRFHTLGVDEYLAWDVMCPRCESFGRLRALWHFYQTTFPNSIDLACVHFAPERGLAPLLRARIKGYRSSSRDPSEQADLYEDITRMSLAASSVDLFLANHVLDCMADDFGAIAEMHRVLKRGGRVIANVALRRGCATQTLARMRSDQQYRIYGTDDVADRFTPFRVELINVADQLPEDVKRANRVPSDVPVLILHKP